MVETNDEMNPAWLTLLGGSGEKSRLKNALILGGAALQAYRTASNWVKDLQGKHSYLITVKDIDPLFEELHDWLIEQLPPQRQRSLQAFTHRTRSDIDEWYDDDDDDGGMVHKVLLRYDGGRTQRVILEGHTIEVSADEPDVVEDKGKRLGKPGRFVIRCKSAEARDAVLRLLARLSAQIDARQAGMSRVYISSRWGSWNQLGDAVPRPIESVVLRADQRGELLEDIRLFLSQEADYRRLGIPWHRGYLLYGPPGTGKTSIAQAVAGELKLDVYYIPLSDLEADTDLAHMLSRVTKKSLLLLEDVDVAHAARERDDTEKGISLSGLLNALDGIVTPHGLITVMTTNDRDALDEALIRPGRADREFPIGYADRDQLERLLLQLLDLDVLLPDVEPEHRVTPAEVVEVIKPFIGADAEKAAAAVQEYLQRRVNSEEAGR